MEKIIALVDCDSFFVSCEQAENPELKGKPVCVLSNNDGCVVSRSKEAKKIGVPMGIPYFMAKKTYPSVIYCSGRQQIYKSYSKRVMDILKNYSPEVEVYSIDEAFLDLTGMEKYYKTDLYGVAKIIQDDIKNQTDIPVSIGVSFSKTLAKYASDKSKTSNGILVLKENLQETLSKIKVDEIWGIGRRLNSRMFDYSIYTAKDITEKTDKWLSEKFGKNGVMLKYELLGKSMYPIETTPKPPKSIQDTSAIGKFTSDYNFLKSELSTHLHKTCSRLRSHNGFCTVVGVMLRTKDFKVDYMKGNLENPSNFELDISKMVFKLFDRLYNPDVLYRSTGVTLDGINYDLANQLLLFDNQTEKSSKLAHALDKINLKYGKDSIKTGFYFNNSLQK